MNRRGFMKAILLAGVAPAFIPSGILTPVRKLIVPPGLVLPKTLFSYDRGLSFWDISDTEILAQAFSNALYTEANRKRSFSRDFLPKSHPRRKNFS